MTLKYFSDRVTVNSKLVFVFDLDDTLYSEKTFLWSGIQSVIISLNTCFEKKGKMPDLLEACQLKDWIGYLLEHCHVSCQWNKAQILEHYHHHQPDIAIYPDALRFITKIKQMNCRTALITDGRSITQRNKMAALGLEKAFDLVVISEEIQSDKPAAKNFELVADYFPGYDFYYFGDNVMKDFLVPNQFGWNTYGLRDRGSNIHSQAVQTSIAYQPQHWLLNFDDFE